MTQPTPMTRFRPGTWTVPVWVILLALFSPVIEIDYYFAPMIVLISGYMITEAGTWGTSWRGPRGWAALALLAAALALVILIVLPRGVADRIIAIPPALLVVAASGRQSGAAPRIRAFRVILAIAASVATIGAAGAAETGIRTSWLTIAGSLWLAASLAGTGFRRPFRTPPLLREVPLVLTGLFHLIFAWAYSAPLMRMSEAWRNRFETVSFCPDSVYPCGQAELAAVLDGSAFPAALEAMMPLHFCLSFVIVASGAVLFGAWLELRHSGRWSGQPVR